MTTTTTPSDTDSTVRAACMPCCLLFLDHLSFLYWILFFFLCLSGHSRRASIFFPHPPRLAPIYIVIIHQWRNLGKGYAWGPVQGQAGEQAQPPLDLIVEDSTDAKKMATRDRHLKIYHAMPYHAMPCYSSYSSNNNSNRKPPQYSALYCTSHRDHFKPLYSPSLTPSATSFLVLLLSSKGRASPCDKTHVPLIPFFLFSFFPPPPSLFSPLFSFFVLHTGVYSWVCSHEGAQRNGMDDPSPPFLLVPSSQEKNEDPPTLE